MQAAAVAIKNQIYSSLFSCAQPVETLYNMTGRVIRLRARGHDDAWVELQPRKLRKFVRFRHKKSMSIVKTLPANALGQDGCSLIVNVYEAERVLIPVFSRDLDRSRCTGIIVPVYMAAWWMELGQAKMDQFVRIAEGERRIPVYTASRVSDTEQVLRIWNIEV